MSLFSGMQAGSFADWALFIVSIAQVFVTAWLAVGVRKLSVSTQKVEHHREIDAGWQTLNLAALGDAKLRAAMVCGQAPGVDCSDPSTLDENETRREILIFYQINLLHQLWSAASGGTIDGDYADPIWTEYLPNIVAKDAAMFSRCLNKQGYNKKFVSFIQQKIKEASST